MYRADVSSIINRSMVHIRYPHISFKIPKSQANFLIEKCMLLYNDS